MSGAYTNDNAFAAYGSDAQDDQEATIEIFDVDFIQTGDMDADTGTLIIEMMDAEGRDVERTHRDVPEELYESWEHHGFAPAMYALEIEEVYPFSAIYDDDEDEDDEE